MFNIQVSGFVAGGSRTAVTGDSGWGATLGAPPLPVLSQLDIGYSIFEIEDLKSMKRGCAPPHAAPSPHPYRGRTTRKHSLPAGKRIREPTRESDNAAWVRRRPPDS